MRCPLPDTQGEFSAHASIRLCVFPCLLDGCNHSATKGSAAHFGLSGSALASFITFETRPDGSAPVDDEVLPLGTGYTTDDGVTITFGFDLTGDNDLDDPMDRPAYFEDTGVLDTQYGTWSNYPEQLAYISEAGKGNVYVPPGFKFAADGVLPGEEARAGDYFLRSSSGRDWYSFVIDYSAPFDVTAATGEIWDLDNQEGFDAIAYDSAGGILGTVTRDSRSSGANEPDLDSQAWVWAFEGLSDSTGGIARIAIEKLGVDASNVATTNMPLAFNDFNATGSDEFAAIPEPGTALMLGLGLAGLAAGRKFKRPF